MKTILKKGIAVNCKTLNEARELKKIEIVKLTEKPKEPELYYAKDIVWKWAKVKIAGWQYCERKIIFADNKKIVYLYREGNRLGYTEDKEAFGKTWQLI